MQSTSAANRDARTTKSRAGIPALALILGTGCLIVLSVVNIPDRLMANPVSPGPKGQLVEFSAPDAGTADSKLCTPNCGTWPDAINKKGTIVGSYTDKHVEGWAFVRDPDGTFHPFQAPGAGLGHKVDEGTVALAINDTDVIAGQYEDSSMMFHAFIRSSAGAFTEFDAPGVGSGAYQYTYATCINSNGTVAGVYSDANFVQHGFIRTTDGTITSFDPPNSVDTRLFANCINDSGVIGAYFIDAGGSLHSFVRQTDGSIQVFDVPGAGHASGQGTYALSINATGEVAGSYYDQSGIRHGFIRSADGASFTTFNVPRSTKKSTHALSINDSGAVSGFTDKGHGFERLTDGSISQFVAPDANAAGVIAQWNNAQGQVIGRYNDANGILHGFVWTP